ncbi:MAG: hypothetical protein LQ350_007672 [Teloschistes chrysophthalmus]|nr:MAG: hypothetical protein LQ350_007672 [Niorma chrysophthalma]
MADQVRETKAIDLEKQDPFAPLDGRYQSNTTGETLVTVETLRDADEALSFLENHPRSAQIAEEGNAILQDPQQLKKLVRKIDLTIAPLLACVYFLQFLDKTTLSYTAVMGIRTDTHLKGQNYSNLSMLFYIGFLAAEFPTQYLAQRISRLGLYLGLNIMTWGLILGFHAACTNFAGLSVVRTLLGVFESCVAPILVLIIAMWYKKNEQGRRVSWFYVCNSLTQIFGGCVAYGVSFAQTGFATWRIFYIAIGALTMVVGALVAVFLPDSPVKARRFTDAEKFDLSVVIDGSRVQGYTSQQSLILTAPTGAIGAVVVLLIGYLSDKWSDRSLIMTIVIIPTILSGCLMIGLDPNGIPKNKGGLLAASFLSGTFGAAFMLLLAWNASNIAGHSKKVTANALTLVAFAVGNILGTQTFQQKEAPGYQSGKISIIATLSALILVVIVLRLYNDHLNRLNQKRLAGMSEGEKDEMKEKMAFADQTDRKNPFFVRNNATWPLQKSLEDEYDTFIYNIPYSNIDVDFIVWLKKPVDRQSLGLAILSGQRYLRNRIITGGERWIQAEDDPFVSIIPNHIWLRNDSTKTASGRTKMTYVTLLRVYEAYMKKNCAASAKYNRYLVRADTTTNTTSSTPKPKHIEPLNLQQYGNEFAEKKELQTRLKWSSVYEAGKFYDHQGADRWYYYVYGQPKGKSEGKTKNEAVTKACGRDVYGDTAIIRSGPGGKLYQKTSQAWCWRKRWHSMRRKAPAQCLPKERGVACRGRWASI